MNIRNEKTLTPNEEIVKELLEDLLSMAVNLNKIKDAKPQRQFIINIINALKNKKKMFTYQDLFNRLLFLMKVSHTKENIAISSKLFLMVKNAYKKALKEKP